MKKPSLVILWMCATVFGYTQTKNFIDQPYLETSAKVDTLVTPDEIHLSVLITEQDTKDKKSVEELENKMAIVLQKIGINLEKQLHLMDLSSDFEKYFLRKQKVSKDKLFSLIVYDAKTAGLAIMELEAIDIANVNLMKTEYTKMEELKLVLRSQAIRKAREQGRAMVKPLNQKIGKALFISDSNTRIGYRSRTQAVGFEMNYVKEKSPQPLSIEFQKIKVETEVRVKFLLE